MRFLSKERVLSALVLIACAILSVVYLWFGFLFILVLIIGGLFEFFDMMKTKGVMVYAKTGMLMGAVIALITFFSQDHTNQDLNFYIILIGLFATFVRQFMRADNDKAVIGMATTLFGVLYVAWLASFLIKIRFMLPNIDGAKLLGFIILVTKAGDIGALLTGSLIGKRPLIPSVSPSKTIEGSLGGIAFSVAAAILGQQLLPAYFYIATSHLVVMGVILGVLGQFGDLTESLIKRDCGVKDSGKLLPGMGGVLDVIDSLLFCAPVFYFYISKVLNTI